VLYQGKSEFYKSVDIQVLKLSFFSKLFASIIKVFKKNYLKTSFEFRIETPDKELKQIFKDYKPDVVLLKAYQNLLAVKTLIIAKKYKSTILMLTQTPYNHIKGSKFLFDLNIKLFQFLKVHAYITPIKINYEVFKKSGIENIYYIPFVYPVLNVPETSFAKDIIKILSVGKFVKRKDQLLLLEVVRRLQNENYRIKLTLIGEIADNSYFEQVKHFIVENNLQNIVAIKTDIAYDKMPQEYQKHNLFVLPSYEEPAAYSIVEAMANALPVICSDQNGTQCYIEEGANGYIFKAKSADDLYEKIKKCISDTKILKEMQKNAMNIHQNKYHPKQFLQNIIRIIGK
jgi:glycosyltransferase involved in cell wall biosynthesis